MKANGGVFLVDDFGRQRMRPEDLLNRWIVPLESRVDYLTLHTGKKIQVPFDVLTVFATNLDPASLADEAFLRRIPYKIPIIDPTLEQFTRIFELNCKPPEPALPPGDGGVSAAAALRAAEPAAPLVPPARPARPGDGAVPVSRRGAGHHAGTARRRLPGLLRGRRRTQGCAAAAGRRASGHAAGWRFTEVKLVNERTAQPVAVRVEIAATRSTRKKGLLGRDSMPSGSALVITPCNAVHTVGMRFPIDVVFVDGKGRVRKIVRDLRSWRMAASLLSRSTIELPAGALDGQLKVGDRVYLSPEPGESAGSVKGLRTVVSGSFGPGVNPPSLTSTPGSRRTPREPATAPRADPCGRRRARVAP